MYKRQREKLQEELAGQLTAFGNDKKKKTAEDIEKCNRIRRNVADMERTGDYSKALRMFAEELTGFLSYFPKEDTLFVLDEPNRLNERMELILYEYTESMKNRDVYKRQVLRTGRSDYYCICRCRRRRQGYRRKPNELV